MVEAAGAGALGAGAGALGAGVVPSVVPRGLVGAQCCGNVRRRYPTCVVCHFLSVFVEDPYCASCAFSTSMFQTGAIRVKSYELRVE